MGAHACGEVRQCDALTLPIKQSLMTSSIVDAVLSAFNSREYLQKDSAFEKGPAKIETPGPLGSNFGHFIQ